MRKITLAMTSLCLLTGCVAPSPDRGFSPVADGWAEIGTAAKGRVRLHSSAGRIAVAIDGVAASIDDPYRAIQLAEMLDAPEALRMLHDVLARDADGAGLEARYELATTPGTFVVAIRISGGDTAVELSLRRITGRSDTTVFVTVPESTRLATAVRGYLIARRPRPSSPAP